MRKHICCDHWKHTMCPKHTFIIRATLPLRWWVTPSIRVELVADCRSLFSWDCVACGEMWSVIVFFLPVYSIYIFVFSVLTLDVCVVNSATWLMCMRRQSRIQLLNNSDEWFIAYERPKTYSMQIGTHRSQKHMFGWWEIWPWDANDCDFEWWWAYLCRTEMGLNWFVYVRWEKQSPSLRQRN